MIDTKCNEYGLDNSGNGFPNCDKQQQQQPIAAKKTALRDLQNDNRNVVSKSLTTPFLKERGPVSDVTKVSGTKRPTSEGPIPTSPICHQSPSSNGANGRFVYIRRKEQELVKNTSENTDKNVNGTQLRENISGEQETTGQQTQVQGQKVSCFPALAPMPMNALLTFSSGGPSVPHIVGKPVNGLSTAGINHPTSTSEAVPVNPQGMSDQNWKERFPHLQKFLRDCDHSSQEEYIQMLKSLSSVGRSRHAVELEKRAIQLLLEEGKELHRMKVLNVLGKTSPKNNVSPTTPQVQSGK